jgi:hypothetical protein
MVFESSLEANVLPIIQVLTLHDAFLFFLGFVLLAQPVLAEFQTPVASFSMSMVSFHVPLTLDFLTFAFCQEV